MDIQDVVSDSELIQKYNNGDGRAFGKLIDRYNQPLMSYLQRMVSDRIAAHDLFQDTFFKVIRALPRYHERGKFSSWLFGIAHHVAIDFLRKQKRARQHLKSDCETNDMELADYEDHTSMRPDEHYDQQELKTLLKQAVETLPVEQKEVLLLRQYSGMTFKEISEQINCPLNTVLGRMRYALLNLRKSLSGDIGEFDHVL